MSPFHRYVRYTVWLGVVALLLVLSVVPAIAQDAGSMTYGESVTGFIGSGEDDVWFFRGSAGDVVTIAVDSNFDSYLILYDEDGIELTRNDDGGPGTDALISGYRLPDTGIYGILLRGYSSFSTGSYTLTLTEAGSGGSGGSGGSSASEGTLRYGESGTGFISSGEEEYWAFSGSAGDIVTISVDSDFDSYLILYDSDGIELERNDDGGPGLDAEISGFRLPASGAYIILVRGFSSFSTGSYTVSLASSGSGGGSGGGSSSTSEGSLSYGGSGTGFISSGEEEYWAFSGSAGDVVTISVDSDFDSYLILFDGDGIELERNDDGGPGLDAEISGFRLPANGTYTIMVRGFSNFSTGSYTVSLELDAGGSGGGSGGSSGGGSTTTEGSLEYGGSGTGFISGGDEHIWTFSGSRGDTVDIAVASDFDSYLILYDGDGIELTRNDDGGPGTDALISGYRLPVNGTYSILVRGFSSASSGTYIVTLELDAGGGSGGAEASPTPTLTPTPGASGGGAIAYGQTIEADYAGGEDFWVFTGSAGDVVTIAMNAEFDTFLRLYGTDGDEITSNDDGGEGRNALIEEFELPSTGAYIIGASAFFSSSSGPYTLTLTLVSDDEAEPTADADATATAVAEATRDAPTEPAVTPDAPAPGGGPAAEGEGDVSLIMYGQTVEGSIASEEADQWLFAGNAGDLVAITVESDFDSYLILFDAAGNELARDDDSGPGTDAAITGVVLPETTVFTIVIRGYSSASTGDYELTLREGVVTEGPTATPEPVVTATPSATATPEPTETPEAPPAEPIAYNDFAMVTLTGDPASFSFEGQAGDTVTISVASSDFDTLLFLFDPDGRLVASNDDAGSGTDSTIVNFVLPSDGNYLILVEASGGSAVGDITLVLVGTPGAGGDDEEAAPGDGDDETSPGDGPRVDLPVEVVVDTSSFTLTANLPEGWLWEANDFGNIGFGSNEAALINTNAAEAQPYGRGNVGGNLIVVSDDDTGNFGLDPGATSVELLRAVVDTGFTTLNASDVVAYDLEGRDAAIVAGFQTLNGFEFEIVIVVVRVDGGYAAVAFVADIGELEGFGSTMEAIALTLDATFD